MEKTFPSFSNVWVGKQLFHFLKHVFEKTFELKKRTHIIQELVNLNKIHLIQVEPFNFREIFSVSTFYSLHAYNITIHVHFYSLKDIFEKFMF